MKLCEKNRLLAIRTAVLCRGSEAAQTGAAAAETIARWLNEHPEDEELRGACLEEALRSRTGGSRALGLLEEARGLYVFAKAGSSQTQPAKAVPSRGSQRAEPRGVRSSG